MLNIFIKLFNINRFLSYTYVDSCLLIQYLILGICLFYNKIKIVFVIIYCFNMKNRIYSTYRPVLQYYICNSIFWSNTSKTLLFHVSSLATLNITNQQESFQSNQLFLYSSFHQQVSFYSAKRGGWNSSRTQLHLSS